LTASALQTIKGLLNECTVHGLSDEVKERAIILRRSYGPKTPDAIIAASAFVIGLPLVTGDKGLRRLEGDLELVFIKYE